MLGLLAKQVDSTGSMIRTKLKPAPSTFNHTDLKVISTQVAQWFSVCEGGNNLGEVENSSREQVRMMKLNRREHS